jgi:hypothetical protein
MAGIVVCGYMIRMPMAGLQLAYAQYLLGFERLGHAVLYAENSGWPDACYSPDAGIYSDDPTPGIHAARGLLSGIGCRCPIAYRDDASAQTYGLDADELDRQLRDADLVINLGGVCWLPAFDNVHRLALVDMDPLFTQVGKFAQQRPERYDIHFTYGTNVGNDGCKVPTQGIEWQPTLPPVVTDLWQVDESRVDRPAAPFTTVANWTAYGAVQWNGQTFGQKDRQFLELLDLPALTTASLEVAVQGMPGRVAEQFKSAGWRLTDAAPITRTFDAYRRYIQASAGEFSVAKHGYVASRAGWISDRTVCYLAAGRPVVVQDTGIPSGIVEGEGWHRFGTRDEAASALDQVLANLSRAGRAARRLAETTFSHEHVLPRLLDRALSCAPHEVRPCAGKSC